MDKNDLQNQINTSLIVLGVQIKALHSALTPEQREIYDKTIEAQKAKIVEHLGFLTPEELDSTLKFLNI